MNASVALLRLILVAATFVVLGWSYIYVAQTFSKVPERVALRWLDVSPDEITPVYLGRDELIQPATRAAAERHLGLIRSDDRILGYDIAPERVVGLYDPDGVYTQTGRIAIPQGQSTLWIGSVPYQAALQGSRLELSPNDSHERLYVLDPSEATFDAGSLTHATSIDMEDRMAHLMRRFVVSFRIGGDVPRQRLVASWERRTLPDQRLPFDAARLVYSQEDSLIGGSWVLARGVLSAAIEHNGQRIDAEARPIEIVDGDGALQVPKIILGRTTYRLRYDDTNGVLRFSPVSRPAHIAPENLQPVQDPRIQRPEPLPSQPLDARSLGSALAAVLFAALLTFAIVWFFVPSGIGPVSIAASTFMFAWEGQSASWATIVPAISAGLVLTGGFLFLFGKPSARWMPTAFAGLFLMAFGVMGYLLGPTFLAFSAKTAADGLAYAVAAVWVAFSAPLFSRALVPGTALFWLLFVVVALFGAISGLRLSVLEQTSAYDALMDRHLIVLVGIGLSAAGILCLSEAGGWALGRSLLLPQGTGWAGRIVLIAFGLGYAMFTASGSETGFMGFFQPSEMAKSLLCFVVAYTLSRDIARRAMLAMRYGGGDIISPLIAICMTGAILVASLLNYDMSPIIVSFLSLMLAFAAGTALHVNELRSSAGERRHKGLPLQTRSKQMVQLTGDQMGPAIRRRLGTVFRRWPSLLLLGVLVPGSIMLIIGLFGLEIFGENDPFDDLSELMRSALLTPWLRVQSWWDMHLVGAEGMIDFPQTGEQLRLGRLAILEAHCRGLDWLCPAGIPEAPGPLANERLLIVPAIQDDFAAINLLHTFGVDGAILYGAAQGALIASALTIGFQTLTTHNTFRIGAWLTGITVIGLTAVVAAQILLAWGNVLGLLPIMGQPMTFVSFGASHHIGVALPFAIATLVCAQTVSFRRPNDVISGLTLYRRRRIS